MRCYLALCVWRDIDYEVVLALQRLLAGRHQHEFVVGMHANDALICRSRSTAASKFLDNPSYGDALVFVDSDICFAPSDLTMLADGLEKGLDMVGGAYVTRSRGTAPHPAFRGFPGQSIAFSSDAEPVEVKYLATGFMGIHRRVLEKVAATMPKCKSGRDSIWPLFLPMVEAGELLSEDYTFCSLAQKLGYKAWLDPRIGLSHIGTKAFTLEDIGTDMDSFYSVVREGIDDPTEIVADMAAYQHKTAEQVLQELKDTTIGQDLIRDWKLVEPSNPESVRAFYKSTTNYIHRMVRFNLSSAYRSRLEKAKSAIGRIADFGGGIGTLSLMLAKAGNQVFYIDLPSQHRSFAEYRFARHGAIVEIRDSLYDLSNLDYVICFDVLEHVHPQELPDVVNAIASSLKPGGILIETSDFGCSDDFPMHFDTKDLFNRLMFENRLFLREPGTWVRK